jgi:DNA-binding MarR family transcriptional regulator
MSIPPADESLGTLLKRAQHALDLALDHELQALDLTPAQYTALAAIDEDPKLSNAELARRCHVTAQTMHRVVALLERDGLVLRKAHPTHGRIQELSVSRKGRTVLTKAHKLVGRVEATFAGGASERDVKVAGRVLRGGLDAVSAKV